MKHYMKLQNDPFTKIKNKTKTIEMRLNDEKRRKIKIHDLIEFTNIKTGENYIKTMIKYLLDIPWKIFQILVICQYIIMNLI